MEKLGDVLVTTSTCPVSASDSQPRFVLDLAASLVPHFNRVHLLAPGAPGAAAREELDGVLVHRFPYAWPSSLQQLCYRHGIMQNIRANPLLLALLPGFIAAQVRAIRGICAEFPVKIVNSHWFVFQSLAAAMVCKGMGIRHVPHSHGADVYLLQRMGGLGRGLGRYVARRADGIICESHYVRDQLDALLGYHSGAAVSCMGVDVGRFGGLEVGRLGGLEVGRLGGSEVGRLGGSEVGRLGGLEVGRLGGLEVGRLGGAGVPPSPGGSGRTSQGSGFRVQGAGSSSLNSAIGDRQLVLHSLGDGGLAILFVGRLVEKKGVEYLVRAMPTVLRQVPGASLKIVGHGALERSLKSLADSMGLTGRGVEFLGSLSHDRIVELLAEARVVVLPSVVDSHGEADGMPTVLLEAMAAQKLVVASRVNGIPDVLRDGENGWLCEPRNVEDLTAKILQALAYKDSGVPAAALKTAQKYDWPVLGARYAGMLKG